MAKTKGEIEKLPEELLEVIFNKLDRRDLKVSSFVSKRFLQISSSVLFHLKISPKSTNALSMVSNLLRRFSNINSIHVAGECYNYLDAVVVEIARSGLKNLGELDIIWGKNNIIPLKSLKIFNFFNLLNLSDNDLFVIANNLPWLEILCISFPVSDRGIAELASKVKGLREIYINGRHEKISDQSLISLSSNCPFLRKIQCFYCDGITEKGLVHTVLHCPNLIFLGIPNICYERKDSCCSLEFVCSISSYILASIIVEAQIPLEKLTLHGNHHLDSAMLGFLKFFSNLRVVTLVGCHDLTDSTFFMLARNCPFLAEIVMIDTGLGLVGEESFDVDFEWKNHAIRSLTLRKNAHLDDETVGRIRLVCPNLEFLDVRFCPCLTEQGIGAIMNICSDITHLKLTTMDSKHIEDSELKLEVWSTSEIDDEGMTMIARGCNNLLYLEILSGEQVTVNGLKEVIESCKELREVRLGINRDTKKYVDSILEGAKKVLNLKAKLISSGMWLVINPIN